LIYLTDDGTLTPIIEVPSEAKLSAHMRQIVEKVSLKFPTAIITGRSITTIRDFVRLNTLYYAGSHGFDIRQPGGDNVICQVGGEFLPLLRKARDNLSALLASVPGSLVEDNKYSVSVHYRRIPVNYWEQVEAFVDKELKKYKGKLKKGHGKMVFEIRANLDWHKGKAVRYLLRTLEAKPEEKQPLDPGRFVASNSNGEVDTASDSASDSTSDSKQTKRLSPKRNLMLIKKPTPNSTSSQIAPTPTPKPSIEGKTSVSSEASSPGSYATLSAASTVTAPQDLFAIYIGDDTTDEDAFRELVSSGRGIGIRVLSAGSDKKQPTAASFVLNSVNQVADFLAKIQQLDASPKSQLQGPRAPQAGPVTAPISSEDLMSTKGPNPTLRPTTNSKT